MQSILKLKPLTSEQKEQVGNEVVYITFFIFILF